MAEKIANPFLALFPTDDAATKAREMKEKQHHELQATLKRVFLITGESKTDNDIIYIFYDFSWHCMLLTQEAVAEANTPRYMVHVPQFARNEEYMERTGTITLDNYDKVSAL